MDPKTIGHVLINRFGIGVRLWKDHTDSPPKTDRINTGGINILAIQKDTPLNLTMFARFDHPIKASKERRFPGTRRTDDRNHFITTNIKSDPLEDFSPGKTHPKVFTTDPRFW